MPDQIPSLDEPEEKAVIPIETIIAYRKQGLSYSEIAKLVGCCKQNIHSRLRTIGYCQSNLINFKKNKSDVLEFLQSKLLNSVDSDSIQKSSLLQRTTAFGILYDKQRLEDGKSTDNVNIVDIKLSINQIQDRAAHILKELPVQDVVSDDCDNQSVIPPKVASKE